MHVAAILKTKGASVTTARPDATVASIADRLASRRIGAIVIVNGESEIAGIISERDIIRGIAKRGASILASPASDLMTRDVVTCTAADTLDNLMTKMTAGRFRHLPVVDSAGALAGIVSIGDIVKYHLAEVTMEAEAMREYIAHT